MKVIKEFYIILDKTNKVVAEVYSEDDAKKYVALRPYLKYQKLEQEPTEEYKS